MCHLAAVKLGQRAGGGGLTEASEATPARVAVQVVGDGVTAGAAAALRGSLAARVALQAKGKEYEKNKQNKIIKNTEENEGNCILLQNKLK